jgi:hypothetical protein
MRHARRATWLLLGLLTAGCLGPVRGTIALRQAQDAFSEASTLTAKQYAAAVAAVDEDGTPPASPDERYREVVDIIDGRKVVDDLDRDDLKVDALALSAFAKWRLRRYDDAVATAERGVDLYRRAGLKTNVRDYGMLLAVRGLVLHSKAMDRFAAVPPGAFLSAQQATAFAADFEQAQKRLDEVNAEIDRAEPIAVWVNFQALRIAQNATDVWSDVSPPGKAEICRWTTSAAQLYAQRFPADYEMKPRVDALHHKLESARTTNCGTPS